MRRFAPQGIILSGSHLSAYEESTLHAPKAVFDLGVPVLGIEPSLTAPAGTYLWIRMLSLAPFMMFMS